MISCLTKFHVTSAARLRRSVNLHSCRPREYKRSLFYTLQIVRSQRAERRRSFRARYSLADADSGSESMSEMEDESKVTQQCLNS